MRFILTASVFVVLLVYGFISEHLAGATAESPDRFILPRLLLEGLVIATFLYCIVTTSRRPRATLIFWATPLILWTLLSGIMEDQFTEGLKYIRYTIYGLMLYYIGYTQAFTRRDLDRLILLISVLLLIQIPASFINLLLWDKTEWRVCLITTQGGSLATLFPLFALCYVLGVFFYFRRSWLLIALGLMFAIVAYASGKRATYFILPPFLIGITFLFRLVASRSLWHTVRSPLVKSFVICCIPASAAVLYGIQNSEDIGSQQTSASVSETIDYAFKAAVDYDTKVTASGKATGRNSASATVLNYITEADAHKFLWGWGPWAMSADSGNRDLGGSSFVPLGIRYGLAGWSRDAICIGYPSVLLRLLFYGALLIVLWRVTARASFAPVWNAIAFGTLASVFVILYDYLYYSDITQVTGTLDFIVLFSTGILTSPLHRLHISGIPNPAGVIPKGHVPG